MVKWRAVSGWVVVLTCVVGAPVLLARGDVPEPERVEPMAVSLLEVTDDHGHGAVPVPVETRREAIEKEIAELRGEHAWAGSYYEGDGLGANIGLMISPKAGAAVTWHGCLGLYGANEGPLVEGEDGTLDLAFNWRNDDDGGFGNFPSRLVPVAWGERSYLIPPDRLIDFVNAINHGHEPRNRAHGMYYLREGDEDKPAPGLPNLPAEYLALIRATDTTCTVSTVERQPDRQGYLCAAVWHLTVTRTPADNLRVGTELRVTDPDVLESAKVIEVSPSTAVLEVMMFGDDTCDAKHFDTIPAAGWRLTTGHYDANVEQARVHEDG